MSTKKNQQQNWKEIWAEYPEEKTLFALYFFSWLEKNYHPPRLKQEGYILHLDRWTVEYIGQEIKLQKQTFRLLNYLYSNKDLFFSRENILKNAWREDVIVLESTVDAHIKKIRTAFPDIPVITKKGLGYGWVENRSLW